MKDLESAVFEGKEIREIKFFCYFGRHRSKHGARRFNKWIKEDESIKDSRIEYHATFSRVKLNRRLKYLIHKAYRIIPVSRRIEQYLLRLFPELRDSDKFISSEKLEKAGIKLDIGILSSFRYNKQDRFFRQLYESYIWK